ELLCYQENPSSFCKTPGVGVLPSIQPSRINNLQTLFFAYFRDTLDSRCALHSALATSHSPLPVATLAQTAGFEYNPPQSTCPVVRTSQRGAFVNHSRCASPRQT